jgi:hypothetical protein
MTRPGPPPATLAGRRVGVSPDLLPTAIAAPHAAAYRTSTCGSDCRLAALLAVVTQNRRRDH